jgi:Virulence-associated protein E
MATHKEVTAVLRGLNVTDFPGDRPMITVKKIWKDSIESIDDPEKALTHAAREVAKLGIDNGKAQLATACRSHKAFKNESDSYIDRFIDPGWAEGQKAPGDTKLPDPKAPVWRECKVNGSPAPSMHNARLAITALGVTCSVDTFHNKVLFGYRDETFKHQMQFLIGEVSDRGVMALRQLASDRFGFDLTEKHVRDAVQSLALENCFDPVCDLIDKAEAAWDKKPRLDRMAVDYFNCEDTPLNRAVLRTTMIALIARARVPGIKFDTILVLESPEGFNKSSAWRVLAGEENFSDEAIIGKESREVQEQLAGVWVHENADLAGMKKSEVETVKTYASRQVDRARPAFGHFLVNQPRRSIEVGTTNNDEYLQSQTGNRRFWPLVVTKTIDIEKLSRDRLQLIGEAATLQSAGMSIVLDEALWPAAAIEQEHRRVKDPWEALLSTMPTSVEHEEYRDGLLRKKTIQVIHEADDRQFVSSADLLTHVLEIPAAQLSQQSAMRLSTVMSKLGWQRPKNRLATINGNRVPGYFRYICDAPH